ncbi:NUDIX hydrolase [Celeribacter arenosi]
MKTPDPLVDRYGREVAEFIRAALAGDEAYLTEDFIALAAQEVALYHGERSVDEVRAVRAMILTRAWARMRAGRKRPLHGSRNRHSRDEITVQKRDIPYSYFFAVEDSTLTHRRYDAGTTDEMDRAGFLMADAVTVLPYDPVRDRVLVVEQFRYGTYVRGEASPWMLEPIAGRIDPGETPNETAAREAREEAGLTIGALHQIAEFYPSPGAASEHITSYVAICDLPDGCAGSGGLDDEHEDIAASLYTYDTLIEMCDAGQLDTGPLYLSALWLARHRDRLRA